MPRLPTMRVIGSQFISTRFRFLVGTSFTGAVVVLIRSLLSVGSGVIAGGEFGARMPPFRFLVHSRLGKGAKRTNGPPVGTDHPGRNPGARWFIHERHELVGKARHGAADADTAHIRTTPNAGH